MKQLANYVYDSGKRANIEAMIEDGELLQAAQKIQENYPLILKELRKKIDYDKIKSCGSNKLYASAVYALPYLFQGSPVITTNFDRVLEEVYDRLHKKSPLPVQAARRYWPGYPRHRPADTPIFSQAAGSTLTLPTSTNRRRNALKGS